MHGTTEPPMYSSSKFKQTNKVVSVMFLAQQRIDLAGNGVIKRWRQALTSNGAFPSRFTSYFTNWHKSWFHNLRLHVWSSPQICIRQRETQSRRRENVKKDCKNEENMTCESWVVNYNKNNTGRYNKQAVVGWNSTVNVGRDDFRWVLLKIHFLKYLSTLCF